MFIYPKVASYKKCKTAAFQENPFPFQCENAVSFLRSTVNTSLHRGVRFFAERESKRNMDFNPMIDKTIKMD
jgi:hypothetical protein